MAEQAKTETGIDLSNFAAQLAAKEVSIIKPNTADGNYLYYKASVTATLVNGEAVKVVGQPQITNINRGSIASMREQLAAQAASIAAISAQVDAVEAEMNRLDAMLN